MEPLPFLKPGAGAVPARPLLVEAWKQMLELPVLASARASSLGLGKELDFTAAGVTMEQFAGFFNAALGAAKKTEAIVEAGNKYSVCSDFKRLNGELLLYEVEQSAAYAALSKTDQSRATEFFKFVYLNGELRNRNPLHPNHLDSAVMGNLMNFPKHIFCFPCASYATDGNEALSLLLFSYRFKCSKADPCVVYVAADGEGQPHRDLQDCTERLNMKFYTVSCAGLKTSEHISHAACVMTSFSNPQLAELADWASKADLGVHIHVWDSELRSIFANNPEPVHLELPMGVRSMSLEDGLFRSAYQLYRDTELRDIHHDLPLIWQSAYISPNEGGSGNTTPLYTDFCFALLGWSAMHDIARKTSSKHQDRLKPQTLPPYAQWDYPISQLSTPTVDTVLDWSKANMGVSREEVEQHVFQFQRNFVGGKTRTVEAVTSGGGTRSGNFAFESVIARAKAKYGPDFRMKLICGNPHLLVERASRRFEFDDIRVFKDGAIDVEALKTAITDPAVAAVYTQTLSITDGITDPLHEVLAVMEEENKRRQAAGGLLVTLINDCCLALSVLIHNDGKNGANNLRVLDMTENCITPTIVMLDAHKHIGADKGVSMAMGTPGTLSSLSGQVKVGSQPSQGALIRVLADMLLVGADGYYEKYRMLGAAVADVTKSLADSGMKLIHVQNKVVGATAFSVEDPSGVMQKKLKKKGHAPSPLFGMAPEDPKRVQTGYLLHLTPHALRQMENGKRALDIFVVDAIESHKQVSASYSSLAKIFRECSLPAFLLSGGNEELWTFELLRRPGFGRNTVQLILRRLYSGILDSGVVCSKKPQAALQEVLKRALALAVIFFVALRQFRRRRSIKS
mmetsp:Transcript_78641/g.138675  ORF Transcript_78641/g.138675 Transcript_78641/m.138675 type:complete len:852 (-) Transcript_78641:99-2654(-)|eukprot:CAMPEP_0197623362 /NCGR_PEP_ID=MMETSP1338-20131121/3393_1 /TAXON_ID=43686 ORGANISM="Pelagodinium beii, Strain RCC1491" /NCGR_SAMPLE_ID=MMETSP1338 /ASSEMBLY_ACC=CAM_ASM_000754 /LENGTH=851 /DNA_ID=CAMNT_0043193315 /DNA_START=38 /DNA_END=2593 /DNA_ORIENTATION=-